MSDIINLLPDSVANQIAAGEVVQRPASVVKELLENSIDAGASSIALNVFDAGKAGIQVVDNGQGMSGTDARLCFERHATSKIHDSRDLDAIATMGFRGEALASIAAVAEVELITRRAEDDMGTRVQLAASRVTDHSPCAAPVGTTLFVRNLFFNVPARLRFLKSLSIELKHVVNEFQRVALANPQVAMRLSHDDAVLYDLRVANRRERILDIFGPRLEKHLLPVEVHTDLVDIEGFIGSPKVAKRRAGEQFLFVNARYMRNPAFNRAIYSAFEKLIAADFMPIFFMFFTVDPSTIDVNIHPQKTEIKFENDRVIWQLLNSGVRRVLGQYAGVPQIDFDAPPLTSEGFFPPSSFFSLTEQEYVQSASVLPEGSQNFISPAANIGAAAPQRVVPSHFNSFSPGASFEPPAAASSVCQIANRYVVTPLGSGLAIVDQHRAHARVLYEKIRAAQSQEHLSQRLALPISLSLTAAQRVAVPAFMDAAAKIGFSVDCPDETTLRVSAMPLWLEVERCADVVAGMLESDDSCEVSATGEQRDNYLQRAAFAAAIRRGQPLPEPQMQALLLALFACQAPAIAPDGAPTYVLLNEEKIKELFAALRLKG